MSILVIFASIEGQTRKIASRVAARLEEKGRSVVLADVRDPGFAVPGRFDGIVLCAPIHMGRYPEAFARFVEDWKDAIEAVPNAFVSVTLSIHSDNQEERAEAMAFPDKLARRTGFHARLVHHAAGALKFLEYDFFKRYLMRRIAAKEGGPVDLDRDHEFTDWTALDAFTDEFVAMLARA
jgi:Flavodoxin